MKKILFILKRPRQVPLCAAIILSIAGCAGFSTIRDSGSRTVAVYENGTWEGEAEGYKGILKVLIRTVNSSIYEIKVLSHREDALLSADVFRQLSEQILETGSTELDAISGATITSEGFLNAVNDALKKASNK
ncbi:MAG: hypothetical protein Ta2G_12360 [Termitinemataceae bacterium]|nr:MAG: hypothetical protein Ta2G_12360 [Termitinemataceae bacterium]